MNFISLRFFFLQSLFVGLTVFLGLGLLLSCGKAGGGDGVLDTLVFGDPVSEKAHQLAGENTKAGTGALGEPVRISLPKSPIDYYGGDLSFEMKVDPVKQNYFTVKFWGSDVNGGQKALLYIDGEQLGYRHLGDYEALNHGASSPSFKDRFFYYTDILPLHTTRGRKSVHLTMRTIGPIAGYQLSGGYDGYQKKMDNPSRGYYRAYTHTTAALAGIEKEKQGMEPSPPPLRPAFEELMAEDGSKRRGRFDQWMRQSEAVTGWALSDFGRTTRELWPELDEPMRKKAVAHLVEKIDLQSAYAYNPDFYAKGLYQGDWGGSFQPVAETILQMNHFVPAEQWDSLLKESIVVKGERQTRRAAWTRMIKGNFDYARTHIARITNQAMFCLHGAYRSNRALLIINPSVAEPEETAKRFLFEAAGIWPYRGSDILDASGKLIGREDPFGEHYMQITDKGLTREFTYVAIYGEVANEVAEYWERYGYDELLKKALISNNARSFMRYSDFDEEGFRGMRMEGVIESRGPAYPDDVAYVQRKRSISQVRLARLMAEHPEKYQGPEWEPYRQMAEDIVGRAQQMFADNQKPSVGDPESIADFLFVKNHSPTGYLLPHTNLNWYPVEEIEERWKPAGLDVKALQRQAWADEDNGVISLRDGDLSLFVGLVMKANWGINGLARIHCITPTVDRLGAVAPDVQYEWSGQWSVRPDWTNVQFMNANNPPEGTLQVLEGEILPFASQPAVRPTVPVDNPYVGYANFYRLHYLKYLIGMNTTRAVYGNARSYTLELPAHFKGAQVYDFISKKELPVKNGGVEVGPQSTVILEVEPDPNPLPMAPRLVAAFSGEQGVTVRWTHSGGANEYLVKKAESPQGPWKELGRTKGENVLLDPTASADKSFYTVVGINENGTGPDGPVALVRAPEAELLAWFDKKQGDSNSPPDAPRHLTGENIRLRVNLKWKVARRGVAYDILRADKEEGPFTVVAKGLKETQWSDENVQYGKKYFYCIEAINSQGVRGPRSNGVEFAPVDDTIPAPWQGTDIGDVGEEGSDGLRDGVFSIRGGGGDVWGSSDALRLVHQPLSGDGTLVVRIADQQNTNAWTKSGIMIRDSLEPGSANVFLFSTPGWGIVLQHREANGKQTQKTNLPVHKGKSPWLKLVRKGDLFTAYASEDGKIWTEVGKAKVNLPKQVQAGLAVCSHSKGALNRTRFDQFEKRL